MPRKHLLTALARFGGLILSVGLAFCYAIGFQRNMMPAALAAPSEVTRFGGYGISVGPHLDSRPDLLNEMGMDWVKVYDTAQIADYPNHRILFRLEEDGYPPEWEYEGWQRGLHEFARELRDRGVDAIEVGNEPNLAAEWGGQTPDPERYVDVLRQVYTAFKEEAPEIVVVSGGLAPTGGLADGSAVDDLWYAQRMIDLGAADYMDAWGYHPYGFDQPPEADPQTHPYSFRRTELMYDLLRRNGIRKQIWITEFGWVRDPAEDGYDCSSDPQFSDFAWMTFDRATQADYTRRALTFAARNWRWAGPIFLWNLNWNLYDADYEPICSNLRWYGVLDQDGDPLPVVYAVQQVPRRPVIDFRPAIGAVADRLTRTAQAGCAGVMKLGSFTIELTDAVEGQQVTFEPANAPGRPQVWTSAPAAVDGDTVDVYVDGRGVDPGMYLVAINVRSVGAERLSSTVVRGWLMLHYPTTSECVEHYEAG